MLILKIIATLCEMFLLIVIYKTMYDCNWIGWKDILIYGFIFLTILISIWI